MEYKKIINLLDNTPNQPTKFRTKNWVENDNSCGTYNTNSEIKFKTSMHGQIYVITAIHIYLEVKLWQLTGARNAAIRLDERNKVVIFKNCKLFTDCTSEINNTQIDNAKYIGVVMTMYNLIKYSDNYSKTSGYLWEYYRDDPNDNITESQIICIQD